MAKQKYLAAASNTALATDQVVAVRASDDGQHVTLPLSAITALLDASLAAKAPLTPTINAQIGTTYILTAADNGAIVTLDNASPIALTLPETATEVLPEGFTCLVAQIGAGQVTVGVEGTDTLESKDSNVKITGQHSAVTVLLRAQGSPNTWAVYGDLSA